MRMRRQLRGDPAAKAEAKPAAAPGGSNQWEGNAGVPQELAASEVQALLKGAEPPLLIDVREDHELAASGWIPGSKHIPMHSIQGVAATELDPQRHVVVYCASGMRSMEVGAFLLEQGFRQVSNLNGGINAWTGPVERAS